MTEAKKYYWLKLKTDFFSSKEIKKLRRIAGGNTYTIIYLKMLLLSVKTGGKLYYENVEESFAEELALELDEDVDNVLVTLNFLERYKLMERGSETEYFLPEAAVSIGSETQGAERVRRFRAKNKALHCNGDETILKRLGNTEIEIEKEIEKIREDIERDKKTAPLKSNAVPKPVRHKYGQYLNVLLSDEDMEKLVNEFPFDWQERVERLSEYIASTGKSYKNHLATIRSWARKDKERKPNKEKQSLNEIVQELNDFWEGES